MDLDELKELLQILDEKEIIEFELEEEGKKLRIRKAAANHDAAPVIAAPILPATLPALSHLATAQVAVAPAPAAVPSPPPAAEAPADEGLLVVKSPIVGTFFRSPDPNSPAFVDVGDRVKPGQVMCIVEAMKLMNEIEAEVAGEVAKVHPQNGQPVQYGDPLFTIRPD